MKPTRTHHVPTTIPGLVCPVLRRRRLARAGMALGLAAAVALTGACTRHKSNSAVDPKLSAWVKTYRAAVDDMSKAAGGRDIPLKEGCQRALDALSSHEAKLVKTPDAKLSELAQGFVDERKAEYQKCAETGQSPSSSKKVREMEARIRELTNQPPSGNS